MIVPLTPGTDYSLDVPFRGTPWSRIEARQAERARGVEGRIEMAADVSPVSLARRSADAPLHQSEQVSHAAARIEEDVEAPEVEEVVEAGEVQDGVRIADALVGMAQDGHVPLHADARALGQSLLHLGSARGV